MTNKTIATLFAVSFALCVLGYAVPDGSTFFVIGGIGMIISPILTAVRLFKLEKDSTLGIALSVSSALFWISAIADSSSSLTGIMSIALWITGIWSIIRLYNTK